MVERRNMNLLCRLFGHKMITVKTETEEDNGFKTTTFYEECKRCPHEKISGMTSFPEFTIRIPK